MFIPDPGVECEMPSHSADDRNKISRRDPDFMICLKETARHAHRYHVLLRTPEDNFIIRRRARWCCGHEVGRDGAVGMR